MMAGEGMVADVGHSCRHEREIAAVDQHRTLREVLIERLLHLLIDYAGVEQQIARWRPR